MHVIFHQMSKALGIGAHLCREWVQSRPDPLSWYSQNVTKQTLIPTERDSRQMWTENCSLVKAAIHYTYYEVICRWRLNEWLTLSSQHQVDASSRSLPDLNKQRQDKSLSNHGHLGKHWLWCSHNNVRRFLILSISNNCQWIWASTISLLIN